MVSHEVSHAVSFEDELTGDDVTVFVETPLVYDDHTSNTFSQSLYLCLDAGLQGGTTTWAHIPRKQAKQIIEAMKEVLDEG